MSDPKTKESTLSALVGFLLTPATVLSDGFVLMKLWGWHVVPITGWPVLTFGHAIGLRMLWTFMRIRLAAPTSDKSSLWLSSTSLVLDAVFLFIGWMAS